MMFKRKRLDLTTDSELMDVQMMEDDKPDLVQCLAERDPQLLKLVHDIMPNDRVLLVERGTESLDIYPHQNFCRRVTGQEIVELANGIAMADNQVKNKITHKLEVIAEQIKFLRQQAINVLRDGQESLQLNHVPCNFRKVLGNTYHLYERPTGQIYFSVLSPDDWQGVPPHKFCGSFLYGHDSSWSKADYSLIRR